MRFEAAIAEATINAPTDQASNQVALAWLRTTYHMVEMQQQLKDQLLTTVQERDQLPTAFYTNIRDMIETA